MSKSFISEEDELSSLQERVDALLRTTLGEYIRDEREKKHLSQKKLSKLTGISAAQISRIESGISCPSKDTLKKISIQIGIPYADLLFLAGYNNISGDRPLYNKAGLLIDTISISESLYRADTELLECLADLDMYATTSDIILLKEILAGIRKASTIRNTKNPTKCDTYFTKTFDALKCFVSDVLTC